MSHFTNARRFPLSYGLAALLCLLALGVKLALGPAFGHQVPFLLFFAAVMLAAWNGGFWPGVFATCLSAVLAAIFFLLPYRDGGLLWADSLRTISFLAEGLVISLLAAGLRSALENSWRRAKRQENLALLSQTALAQAEVEPLFQSALEAIEQSLEPSHIAVFELQPENETFIARAATGWLQPLTGFILPINEDTHAGYSLRRREAIVVEDTQRETRFQIHPIVRENGIRSSINVVIGTPETPLGILGVHSTRRRVWTPGEREFVQAVANVLAVAVLRSRSEKASIENAERYRAFVGQSSEAIWRIELREPASPDWPDQQLLDHVYQHGYLAECNDAMARLYGYERAEDLVGAPLGDLMVRSDPKNEAYLLAFLHSDFRLADAESHEITKDGQDRIFSNNLIGILENGMLVRAWGTQRDITAQKVAENQLKESEARYRSFFAAAPIGVALVRDGVFLYANDAQAKMLAFDSPAELEGRSNRDFVPPGQKPRSEPVFEQFRRDPMAPFSGALEGVARRKNGETFDYHSEFGSIQLPDGPALVIFTVETTAQKRAEAERATLLAREQRAGRRAERLQVITAALAGNLTWEEAMGVIVSQGVAASEAQAGALWLPTRTGLRMSQAVGYSPEFRARFAHVERDQEAPVAQALREDKPVWIENFPPAENSTIRSLAALPLRVGSRLLAVVCLSFEEPHRFDDDERTFILTLVGQCAQGLERARLLVEAQESARMQQESLALLDTLLESAPVGFAFFDCAGRHVLVNDALAEINGLAPEEHLGYRIADVLPEMDGRVAECIERVLETSEPMLALEFSGVTPAAPGEERNWLTSFYPVRTTGKLGETTPGELLGVGTVTVELTERVRAERERTKLIQLLEAERARLEAVLSQMPSAVIIVEAPSGRLLLRNEQVAKIWRRELAANNITDYIRYEGFHADGTSLAPEEWPLARAIQRGETITGEEIQFRRGDDTMGVMRVNASPLRDREGQISGGVAVFDDITMRARSDASQRFLAQAGSALVSTLNQEAALKRLVDLCVPQLTDWCAVLVPVDGPFSVEEPMPEDGTIELKHLAIAYANAEKKTVADQFFAHTMLRPNEPRGITNVLRTGKGELYSPEEMEMIKTIALDDPYFQLIAELEPVSSAIVPLVARGRTLGVLTFMTAESGRVYDEFDMALFEELGRRAALAADNARLFQEAREARDEAQAANRAKDEFLAVVSHELRTPLTPIMGWIDLLRLSDSDAAMRQQAYEIIERNARAQSQIVNDILDVSRIVTGKLMLNLQPLEIAPFVGQAVLSLSQAAQKKNIELTTNLQPVGWIKADLGRMQQVVWNLLYNAIKFTPSGGSIAVAVDKQEAEAIISMTDSGSGIAPEFLPYIFERFRQADSSSTRAVGGLGLGLSIVRFIAEAHGGRVEARSAGEGQGATFQVFLPLLAGWESGINATPKASDIFGMAPLQPLKNLQVLLVDDDPDGCEVVRQMLNAAGAQVETASSGAEALEKAASHAPEVIVSDIGMPQMNGHQLLQNLRATGFEAPALALTAYVSPADRQAALKSGFAEHLGKPVNSTELIRLIGEIAAPKSANSSPNG